MNATIEVPEVIAESTHSRIDWTEPTANEHVTSDTGAIAVLRDVDGKFVAIEDLPEVPDIAKPITLVQHMASSDLRRQCIVWAKWDGVKEAGFWESVPTRMPLYRAEGVEVEQPAKAPKAKAKKAPTKRRERSPRAEA